MVQNETIHDKVKKLEKRIRNKYPTQFGHIQAAFDGLINIHVLYDKRKEIDGDIDDLTERRDGDDGILEHVTTMREGQGLGDLAL